MTNVSSILRIFDVEIVRFGIVGVAASLTHFVSVYLIVSVFGLQPILANIFAFLIAFGVSYIGHSLWTFSHKKHQHNKTVARFLGVAIFSFALNEGGYYLLLEYTQLEYLVSLLIVLIIVPVITFILSKYWAFS
ncbi:MAG: GtrA family protein [Candidatus Thiodiazotropha sp.]